MAALSRKLTLPFSGLEPKHARWSRPNEFLCRIGTIKPVAPIAHGQHGNLPIVIGRDIGPRLGGQHCELLAQLGNFAEDSRDAEHLAVGSENNHRSLRFCFGSADLVNS